MSVQPNAFLESAKALISENTEIAKRNSVSRAYYAAFHRAQITYPFVPPRGKSTHKSYFEHLELFPPGSVERVLGVKLKTMHGRRVIADYKLRAEIPISMPAMQIIAAEDVYELLKSSASSTSATI